MQKWEYLNVRADLADTSWKVKGIQRMRSDYKMDIPSDNLFICIEELGNEGWELVSDSTGEYVNKYEVFSLEIRCDFGAIWEIKNRKPKIQGDEAIIEYINKEFNAVQISGIIPNTGAYGDVSGFHILFTKSCKLVWRRLTFKRPIEE